jgi:hypothetical protein
LFGGINVYDFSSIHKLLVEVVVMIGMVELLLFPLVLLAMA